MAKGYECLSRRALIKLNNDFDAENDEMLLKYLEEHLDSYEEIRPVEKISDSVDNVVEKAKDSATKIKTVFTEEKDALMESGLNVIDTTSKLVSGMLDIFLNNKDAFNK